MKEVKAILRNLQISPRKVQLVAEMIRGASVAQARQQLAYSPKRAAKPVLKLLNSAVANADHNFKLDTETLRVKNVMVGQGPTLKRFMPRAFGRATTLRKHMSHVKLVLEGEETKAPALKQTKKSSKPKTAKEENPADIEKQPPKKKEPKPATEEHKEIPPDPRMQGHERATQHAEKKNKKIIKT